MSHLLASMLFVGLLPAQARAAAPGEAAPQDKDAERFRAAVALLEASNDTKDLLKAMDVLRSGFPASRPVLVEAAGKGSVKLKCFALQVLGESGEAGEDLDVVVKGLSDPKAKVRLAAVMAVRRLGKDGYPALAAYLPGEEEPNNRKMAVKTIQHWDVREAIPLLVKLLKAEKEKAVRGFLVTALEWLARKKLGDDLAAWEAVVADQAMQDQAKALIAPQNYGKESKKP